VFYNRANEAAANEESTGWFVECCDARWNNCERGRRRINPGKRSSLKSPKHLACQPADSRRSC
jgi:hypothetical protein